MEQPTDKTFGWFGIIRLGIVQMALGAIIILTTSTINRVMVVELALPASLPGLLVGWHYAVQITRPKWGYNADRGGKRLRWIIGGLMVLAVGAVGAAGSAWMMESSRLFGLFSAFMAFTLIGAGVGASGTNLLALLAIKTRPEQKAAAAAIVWIMMIVGFVLTAALAGRFLDPFTFTRLVGVTACVGAIAIAVASIALLGMNTDRPLAVPPRAESEPPGGRAPEKRAGFAAALAQVWTDRETRLFTAFVFVSMLAYSAQDLILEPFAGLIFDFSPGASTKLAAVQNSGVLLGMIATACIGTIIGKSKASFMRRWTLVGCLASGAALAFLAFGALSPTTFPLRTAVFSLGVANGMFAVAAIGSMMALASANGDAREGTRMGIWGAAQAVAFGIGGLIGAAAIDLVRWLMDDIAASFALVFSLEGATFVIAAWLALKVGRANPAEQDAELPFLPAEQLPAE